MRFVLQIHAILLLIACVASVPYRDSKSENECGISDYEFGQRIIGGKDVPPKKYPWLADFEIEINGVIISFCTGSVISNRFILTASHCKFDQEGFPLDISKIRALVGSVDRRKAKKIPLRAFHSHADFAMNQTSFINDVAVVELEEEIDFDSNARPICLGKDFVEHNGSPAVIAGWGMQRKEILAIRDISPEILQEGTADFLEYEPCRKARLKQYPDEPKWPKMVKEQHICILGSNKSDVWKGDSGGPLFTKSEKETGSKVRWVQHGVCSFSSAHHHDGIPAVFTRLTTFCDWIKETTKGEAECVDF
ncbi:trypsin domain-containing protein [Ditylenchus destructor]|nr:trypsin domain-containing protein [Ditylenchus destructor]